MLKKLGIVAAVSAAGLIAVSPLALAGTDDGKDHPKKDPGITDSQICSADQSYGGVLNLLNIGNGNVASCDNVNVQVAVVGNNDIDN